MERLNLRRRNSISAYAAGAVNGANDTSTGNDPGVEATTPAMGPTAGVEAETAMYPINGTPAEPREVCGTTVVVPVVVLHR